MTAQPHRVSAWQAYRASVAAFRAQRQTSAQTQVDALVLEAVAALAVLLGAPSGTLCPACHRALAPRVRTCPYCRDAEVTAVLEAKTWQN